MTFVREIRKESSLPWLRVDRLIDIIEEILVAKKVLTGDLSGIATTVQVGNESVLETLGGCL